MGAFKPLLPLGRPRLLKRRLAVFW
ncbi:hypothetical protein [Desulfosporosinus shakirovi]|nr:hypothetical protein [Desulfosporosinus sp. SRJS8]